MGAGEIGVVHERMEVGVWVVLSEGVNLSSRLAVVLDCIWEGWEQVYIAGLCTHAWICARERDDRAGDRA